MSQVYIDISEPDLEELVIDILSAQGWQELVLPEERRYAAVAVTDDGLEILDLARTVSSGLVLFLFDVTVLSVSLMQSQDQVFSISKEELRIGDNNAIRQLIEYPNFVLSYV